MEILKVGELVIREDSSDRFVCLSDLWAASGKPKNLRPQYWLRQSRPAALVTTLERHVIVARRTAGAKNPESFQAVRVTGRTRNALQWAHPVVALDYAEALSPELSIEVKSFFLAHRRSALQAVADVVGHLEELVDTADERIGGRLALVRANRQVRGEGMAAGCVHPADYRLLSSAHYLGLYLMTLGEIKRHKGLTEGAPLPDYMGTKELGVNCAAKIFQVERLLRLRPDDPQRAAEIIEQAALEVRRFFETVDLRPEDLPPEIHIDTERRRMLKNAALLESLQPHLDDFDNVPDAVWEAAERDAELPPPTARSVKTIQ